MFENNYDYKKIGKKIQIEPVMNTLSLTAIDAETKSPMNLPDFIRNSKKRLSPITF